jgi:hypothetical protein
MHSGFVERENNKEYLLGLAMEEAVSFGIQ